MQSIFQKWRIAITERAVCNPDVAERNLRTIATHDTRNRVAEEPRNCRISVIPPRLCWRERNRQFYLATRRESCTCRDCCHIHRQLIAPRRVDFIRLSVEVGTVAHEEVRQCIAIGNNAADKLVDTDIRINKRRVRRIPRIDWCNRRRHSDEVAFDGRGEPPLRDLALVRFNRTKRNGVQTKMRRRAIESGRLQCIVLQVECRRKSFFVLHHFRLRGSNRYLVCVSATHVAYQHCQFGWHARLHHIWREWIVCEHVTLHEIVEV